MQNRVVRLCRYFSKSDHVFEHYHQLLWLPMRKLIQLLSVCLMHCQYHHAKCIPLVSSLLLSMDLVNLVMTLEL